MMNSNSVKLEHKKICENLGDFSRAVFKDINSKFAMKASEECPAKSDSAQIQSVISQENQISLLQSEVLRLKTCEVSLNRYIHMEKQILKETELYKEKVKQFEKLNSDLNAKLRKFEDEFGTFEEISQTHYQFSKEEALNELYKTGGLGFDENQTIDQPKSLSFAVSQNRSLYDYEIIKRGNSIGHLVFKRASKQEKADERITEDLKRKWTKTLEHSFDYFKTNCEMLKEDYLRPKVKHENDIPTYSTDKKQTESRMMYYTPTLILEKQLEELQTMIYVLIINHEIETACVKEKEYFQNNQLKNLESQLIKIQKEKADELSDKKHSDFEELKDYFIQNKCLSDLEISFLVFDKAFLEDKFQTVAADLESRNLHLENRDNKSRKLLDEEKLAYTKLFEEKQLLKEKLSLFSKHDVQNSSELEEQFKSKIDFYKNALLSKDVAIEKLIKEIDLLKISKSTCPLTSKIEKEKHDNEKSVNVNQFSKGKGKGKSKFNVQKEQQSATVKEQTSKEESSKTKNVDKRKNVLKTHVKTIVPSVFNTSKVQSDKSSLKSSYKSSNASGLLLTKHEAKILVHSTPKLFDGAPAHFKASMQQPRDKRFKSKQNVQKQQSSFVSQQRFVSKTSPSQHKTGFSNKSSRFKKPHSGVTPQQSVTNWCVKRSKSSESVPPKENVKNPWISPHWTSYSINRLYYASKWASANANKSGPNLQWVPKSVACAGQ